MSHSPILAAAPSLPATTVDEMETLLTDLTRELHVWEHAMDSALLMTEDQGAEQMWILGGILDRIKAQRRTVGAWAARQ